MKLKVIIGVFIVITFSMKVNCLAQGEIHSAKLLSQNNLFFTLIVKYFSPSFAGIKVGKISVFLEKDSSINFQNTISSKKNEIFYFSGS
jgi:hypothetical protein